MDFFFFLVFAATVMNAFGMHDDSFRPSPPPTVYLRLSLSAALCPTSRLLSVAHSLNSHRLSPAVSLSLSPQESKPSGRASMPRCRNSVATTTSDDQPHIGNYRLLKTIGKGNFAKVKLARHVLTGKEVSISSLQMQVCRKSLSKS